MKTSVRIPLLLLLGLLAAAAARAQDPFPCSFCTVPSYVDVYACRTGVPDPLSGGTQNRVVVRDLANLPVVGVPVTIAFCPDVRIYGAVPGHPELVVTCGNPVTIRGITDAAGAVQFVLIGATVNLNGSNGTGANCAAITVGEGISSFTSYATVAVYDENGAVGSPGVEGGDLAGWLGDFGKRAIIGYKGRSDFSHNDMVEGADLSLWLKVFGLGNSSQGAGALCP